MADKEDGVAEQPTFMRSAAKAPATGGDAKTGQAAAAAAAEPKVDSKPTGGTRKVDVVDILGQPSGFSIDVGPEVAEDFGDDALGYKALAARVTGWSKFHLDGEPYEFSRSRAAALFSRFPHIAKQLTET